MEINMTDNTDELFKSDTYNKMEKMIENIKVYRQDYCGSRNPAYIHATPTRIRHVKKLNNDIQEVVLQPLKNKGDP